MTLPNLSGVSWLDVYPWLLSMLSMTCVYFLNNYKLKRGRYLGVGVACGWFAFGCLTNQWFFLFTNVIYAWIYINAIIKFNKKQNEYKNVTEEQAARLQELEQTLYKRQSQMSEAFQRKHRRMMKMAKAANLNAERIARETGVLVKSLERLQRENPEGESRG